MPITRSSLPVRLELSQGPSSTGDQSDCPICQEPFKIATPVIVLAGTTEDAGCGHRFCEECMFLWLNSKLDTDSHQQRTCPTCRGRIFEPSIWELPAQDRAESFLDSRRQREAPTRYHAVGDPESIATILGHWHPEISESDLIAEARNELALSDDMIDTLGIESLEVNYDIFEISYLYRRRHEVRLRAHSIDFLWRMSRLLGANFWYIAQLDSAPETGFLIPHIPALTILGSGHTNVVEDFYRSATPEYPFATVQVPLETDFLLEILEDRNMFSNGRQATELATVRQVRQTEGVTHWIICDTDRDHIGAAEIHVLPWPRGAVSGGFETLRYPDEDRTSLSDFVRERIVASAALMERRWVRSQHRLHELTGQLPVDESDEDTDDDEEAEDGESEMPATGEEEQQNSPVAQTTVEVSDVAINVGVDQADENEPDPYEISEAATDPLSEEEQQTTDALDESNEDSDDGIDDYPDEEESFVGESSDDSDVEEDSSVYTPTESDEEDVSPRQAGTLFDSDDETPSQPHHHTRPKWDRDTSSTREDDEDQGPSAVPVADEEAFEDWAFLSVGSAENPEEQPVITASETRDEPGHQLNDANASAPVGHTEGIETRAPRQPPEANQPGFAARGGWGSPILQSYCRGFGHDGRSW